MQDIFNTPRMANRRQDANQSAHWLLFSIYINKIIYIYIPSIWLVLKIMWNPKFFMDQSPTLLISSIWHQDFWWSAHVNSPVLIKDLPRVAGPTVLLVLRQRRRCLWAPFIIHRTALAPDTELGPCQCLGPSTATFQTEIWGSRRGVWLCPWLGGLKDA